MLKNKNDFNISILAKAASCVVFSFRRCFSCHYFISNGRYLPFRHWPTMSDVLDHYIFGAPNRRVVLPQWRNGQIFKFMEFSRIRTPAWKYSINHAIARLFCLLSPSSTSLLLRNNIQNSDQILLAFFFCDSKRNFWSI